MPVLKPILLCLLGACWILPAPGVSAQSAESQKTFPPPKGYVYKEKGLARDAEITLNKSGVLPRWLSMEIQHRSRYETLDRGFRNGATGSDQVYALRTLAQATVHLPQQFKIQLEFQDSRGYLNDSGSVVNNTIVNAAELLEANLQWRGEDLFQNGSRLLVRAGRMTMDFGKRRLVARNRYRNTKNAFTGIDAIWQSKDGEQVRAMVTMPVNRLPSNAGRLLDNEVEFDEESPDTIFWGLFLSTRNAPWGDRAEVYLFGLHEDDGDFATRNRQLYTPGFRLFRPAKGGHFDYEWESVVQFGESRSSTAPGNTADLDHFAYFLHGEVGYSFETAWSPRLVLAWDYASGDSNPGDGKNGTFNSLFGANVFDYGPTTIHRAFVRSNVNGPGVKLNVQPHRNLKATLHYRAFWLASDTDTWAGNSGLRDTTGRSGSFLGHQIYLSAAWQATSNIFVQAGVAHRLDGDFQDDVPGSPRQGNSTYSYVATTFAF
ncbi:alginate export family protein [Nitrospina sp. 32_T5]|uniref:alginate export family protein n=1 Tax=unclassified Nitrospina TaxID=2638683 RepID=UPI003F9484A8